MYLKHFPKKLKKLRISNKLTQSELASILETTKQAISSYESGKSNPSLFALIKLSEHFNISIDSLIFDKDTSDKLIDINNNDLYTKVNLEIKNLRNMQKNLSMLFSYFLKEVNNIPTKISEIDCEITKLESLLSKKDDTEFSDELCPEIIDFHEYKESVIYRDVPVLGAVAAGNPCYAEGDIIDMISIPEDLLSPHKEYYILNIKGDSMNKLFNEQDPILVECINHISNNDIAIVLVGTNEATVKKVKFEGDSITLIPMSTNPIHEPKTHNIKDVCFQGKVVGKLSDVLRPSL